MALYETIYIARQDMAAEDVDKLTQKLEDIITEQGAKTLSKEYWGLRKLAYKINKSDRGHYILLNIDAQNDAIKELDRKMSLNEDIVRHMIITKTSDFEENSQLFASKDAKSYKPAKVSANKKEKEEEEGKYSALLKKLQFDN